MNVPLFLFQFVENILYKTTVSAPRSKKLNKCNSTFSCILICNKLIELMLIYEMRVIFLKPLFRINLRDRYANY